MTHHQRRRLSVTLVRLGLGAVLGIVTAGVALGVAQFAAVFVRPEAMPVIAVGNRFVVMTPEWLKEFAVRTFGENDKAVLVLGIYALLAGYAVVVGVLGLRFRLAGVVGVGLFGVLGLTAAVTQHGAGPLDGVPTLVGVAAGLAAFLLLRHLFERAGRRSHRPRTDEPDGDQRSADRPVRDLPAMDRRRALAAGIGAVALGAVGAATGLGGRMLQAARFSVADSRARVRLPRPLSRARPVPPGTEVHVPGISPWRTPTGSFYRVDTALSLPQVPAETWRLRVHGMVRRELTLSYADLVRRGLVERDITLTCVSNEVGGNLAGNARWLGARLADLLREAGVRPGADQLVSRSADGMTIGTPVATVLDGRDALLAVAMNGEPLPVRHGFPVRMIVPGLYGYVSACKWLVDLELTTFDAYDPYWVRRGWAARAPIRTASRIDTPKPFAHVPAGSVTVAGVAWAQHRGIARVQVRVDGGDWHDARLAGVPGADTWRQWTFGWAGATPGDHRLTVRATDATGAVQTERRATPFPRGSAGWHTIAVTVG